MKPANILWSGKDGVFKIIDFGLSYSTREEDIHQVQSEGEEDGDGGDQDDKECLDRLQSTRGKGVEQMERAPESGQETEATGFFYSIMWKSKVSGNDIKTIFPVCFLSCARTY